MTLVTRIRQPPFCPLPMPLKVLMVGTLRLLVAGFVVIMVDVDVVVVVVTLVVVVVVVVGFSVGVVVS